MKKLNWLFLSLVLFLGLGTAFAQETEGEGDNPGPSITLAVPEFKPADGSAVPPGTIVTVTLPDAIMSNLEAYQGVVVIYVENNDEVELLPDAATLSAASAADMGMGLTVEGEDDPEPRLWKTATYEVEEYKMWMSQVKVSATEGTSKLRMRLAAMTYEDRSTVQFSPEFTATYTIDPDAVVDNRPTAPTFTLEGNTLYLENGYTDLLHAILYVVNGTDAAFDGITDAASFGTAMDNGTVSEYNPEEGIAYEEGQTVKAVTAEIITGDMSVVLSAIATYPETTPEPEPEGVPAPVFNPDGGEVEPGTKVMLTNGTENDETPLPIYYNMKNDATAFANIKTKAQLESAQQPGNFQKLWAYPADGIEITKNTPVNAATARIDAENNVSWSEPVTREFRLKVVAPTKPEAPVFTPNGGEVANGVPAITLTTDCDDCDIYYTIGGSEENFYPEDYDELGSAEQKGVLTAYDGAITIMANASISAGAALVDEDGKITWSDIVTKSFTVTGEAPETVERPVITPGNDAPVHIGDLITITCETEGAEIWYTANGKKPYTEDNTGVNGISPDAVKYEAPFALTEDMLIEEGEAYALRIRAVAKKGDLYATAAAGPNPYPNNPEFSVEAGEVLAGTKVSLSCVPSQADIYYTLDGTTPTMEEGTPYTEPIEITEAVTLKARAVLGQYQSNVVTAAYTIKKGEDPEVETVAAPVFSLASGEVEKGTEVTIACVTEGATIYYALTDLPEDLTEATEYKEPIVINEDVTIKAIAVKGEAKSEVVTAAYTVKPEGPTANEDEELAGVTVYPNPSNGVVNIELPVAATVEVFAINGVLMQHFNANAGITTLNINRSGIYFLRITGEGRTAIKRIIVR